MSRSFYSFKNFTIDPTGRELRENGVPVELPASAFDCLIYLIEHRDRTVGRDELISATWGSTATSDTTLAHTIVRLRRLFGDAGKEQHTIRTVPRVGFRWIAAIDGYVDAAPTAVPATAPVPSIPVPSIPVPPIEAAPTRLPDAAPVARVRRRASRLFLIAAAAIAAVAVPYVLSLSPRIAAPPRAGVASIVLPANTQTLSSEWAWLRFAVADLVASRLTRHRFAATPSERVGTPSDAPHAVLPDVADADALRIQPDVVRVDDDWRVTLTARGASGQAFVGEGVASDALEATRQATDAFLDTAGYARTSYAADAVSGSADTPSAAANRRDAILAAAAAASAQEHFEEAADRLAEAREIADDGADGAAKVDVAFGALLVRRQQPAMALPYLRRAMARLDQTRGSPVLLDALTAIAQAHLALRDNDAALVVTSRAWSFLGTPRDVSSVARTRAQALAASGDVDGARRLVGELHARTPLDRARLHAMRAWLALESDDLDEAVDAATLALTSEFAQSDRLEYAQTWIDKIQALQRARRHRESGTELERLTRWCGTTCTSSQALRLALRAGQATAEQRQDEALALYADALRVADRTATPAAQSVIVAACLEALVAADRMNQATAVAGRLTASDVAGLPPRARAAFDAIQAWQEKVLGNSELARTTNGPYDGRRNRIAR